MMLIHVNAKGFFLPDGQRPSKRDLLDLQCVRGRQYFFIFIPFSIFIFFLFRDGSMNIQEFVLCWNKWIKKVGFAEYLSSPEIGTLSDCPAKKRNHNC